jgi:hypothetical protein
VKYFATMAAQLSSRTTIWFIDYRLKRKMIAPTQQQARLSEHTFYGSDRLFVEVMGAFKMDYDRWWIVPRGEGEMPLETETDMSSEAMESFLWEPWDLALSESEDDDEYSSSASSHDEHEEFSNEESDTPFSELESEWLFRGDWFLSKIEECIKHKIEESIQRDARAWVTRYFDIATPAIGRGGAKFGLLACEYL